MHSAHWRFEENNWNLRAIVPIAASAAGICRNRRWPAARASGRCYWGLFDAATSVAILAVVRIGVGLALRLFVTTVLVLGIVIMHHVAQQDHDPAASHTASVASAHDDGMVSGPQEEAVAGSGAVADDLLHLCLAILTGLVVLLVGLLLLGRLPLALAQFRLLNWGHRPRRAPPRRYGFSLLISLGVMRT